MTWAQNQRLLWVKNRMEQRQPFRRTDMGQKFSCSTQTASATIKAFHKRYPGVMTYDPASKRYVPWDHVPETLESWRDRALLAEEKIKRASDLLLTASGMNIACYPSEVLAIFRDKEPTS